MTKHLNRRLFIDAAYTWDKALGNLFDWWNWCHRTFFFSRQGSLDRRHAMWPGCLHFDREEEGRKKVPVISRHWLPRPDKKEQQVSPWLGNGADHFLTKWDVGFSTWHLSLSLFFNQTLFSFPRLSHLSLSLARYVLAKKKVDQCQGDGWTHKKRHPRKSGEESVCLARTPAVSSSSDSNVYGLV